MPTTSLVYGRIANAYDAFLTFSGFKRGIENFLDRIEFDLPPKARLLDAGCGTGLLARYLARRFPSAEIVAFDIDRKMLLAMERQVQEQGLTNRSIIVAEGDLKRPDRLRRLRGGDAIFIPREYFDAVIVSGALEYAPLASTLAALARLLKPGGMFLNIGMRDNPTGAILSLMYRCRPYGTSEMRAACADAGLIDVRALRLRAEDFPANLSRIAITAQKRYE